MKLEIKLDDPKYCDFNCKELQNGKALFFCNIFGHIKFDFNKRKLIRPQECIEKNGE